MFDRWDSNKVATGPTKAIRIRNVSQGRLMAESWGIQVDKLKPWENRVHNLSMPEKKRMPIDREDARILGRDAKMPKKKSKQLSPVSVLGRHDGIQKFPTRGGAQSAFGASPTPATDPMAIPALRIHAPTKEDREGLAIAVAEAQVDDAAKGDKVATLAALLGDNITNSMGQEIPDNLKGKVETQGGCSAEGAVKVM